MPKQRADRLHGEDQSSSARTGFERDRDRILYSDAFRRLAGVTQVVHAAEGHAFHNRLTHSLKVAQVGRRLAQKLLKDTPKSWRAASVLDPDVVEAASLAHDLGHPPFGHIAEEELNTQVTVTAGVEDGFEGNAQSFRIVTRLAVRSRKYGGLNLTRASLNAILKYPWGHEAGGKAKEKWGHYYGEGKEFRFARGMGPRGREQSCEAALMDWADDVTYAVHDVEDFYRAGIIPLDRLFARAGSPDRDSFLSRYVARWDKPRTDVPDPEEPQKLDRFFTELSDFAHLKIDRPYEGTTAQRASLNEFSSLLITRYIRGVAMGKRNNGNLEVRIEPSARLEVNALKALMRHYVFGSPALVAQQYGQRRVVESLFKTLHGAAQPESKDTGIIPFPYRDLLTEINRGPTNAEEATRERARLVADIIANLTEKQALDLHQRLTGIAPGSVLDEIVR